MLLLLWLIGVVRAESGPAVQDALKSGRALCKVLSLTDAGVTGSRQGGLYLPKQAWRFFSSAAPVEDENRREDVSISWPGGEMSGAVVSWYGKGTRSEFRLTRLGERIGAEAVGDLLVLVPQGESTFKAHLLRTEAEADEFCSALGIEPGGRWGFYEKVPAPPTEGDTIEKWASEEAAKHDDFPDGKTMADLARQAVRACRPEVLKKPADDRLLAWMESEYAVYRAIERRVCDAQVKQNFASVEDFIAAASSIMNRRKSRAGHSLEAHVEFLLVEEGIVFEAQATIDGHVKPDILFPGKEAYNDPAHPVEELVVLGLKTTCRDRWRQVLNEGKRIPVKHLLTLQPAMSRAQLTEMQEARLQLVVPAQLHRAYDLPEGARLLSVEEFVREMRRRFPRPEK
jgi:EcoRII C terminal/Restriction endonuclease EcoRII, N-terminal